MTDSGQLHFVREYYLSDIGVCDKLIDLFNISKKLGFTNPGLTGNYEINRSVKDSEDLSVEGLPRNNVSIPSPSECGFSSVMGQFSGLIPTYYTDTNAPWRQEVEFKTLPHIQYYKPGGGYHGWHCDAMGDRIDRHLVFILYLNDVPNGGTEFFHQKHICEAKKGKILMFPANFCYSHRSQVSMTHEKYILTGWANASLPQEPDRAPPGRPGRKSKRGRVRRKGLGR